MFNTPILLIIFNRPEKLSILMSVLAKIKPSKLYISADGPRKDIHKDNALCAKARGIATNVNWPCEIKTNFAIENLGFGGNKAYENAINWFFNHESEGIILEDDCLPALDFFSFTETLLEKYRENEKVMMICGTNFQNNKNRDDEPSYYFSVYPSWGWAMWRRTWLKFDNKLNNLDNFIKLKKIDNTLNNDKQKSYWINFFKKIKKGKFHFVDAKLQFALWDSNGVCIIPTMNLVQNIGFDNNATNTFMDVGMSIPCSSMDSLKHHQKIIIDRIADDYFYNKIHKKNFFIILLNKTRIVFRQIYKRFFVNNY